MINRCIGCYYHDNKENVCTHGSPIFLDDVCTDYQDSEFVMQIKADAIEEFAERVSKTDINASNYPMNQVTLIKMQMLKEQK